MFNIFKDLIGGSTTDLKAVIENGATILDVRSPQEFAGGHVAGSINIPVSQIDREMNRIKNFNNPIITCCATGVRSGTAKNKLKAQGLEAYNGGGWISVNRLVNL